MLILLLPFIMILMTDYSLSPDSDWFSKTGKDLVLHLLSDIDIDPFAEDQYILFAIGAKLAACYWQRKRHRKEEVLFPNMSVEDFRSVSNNPERVKRLYDEALMEHERFGDSSHSKRYSDQDEQ